MPLYAAERLCLAAVMDCGELAPVVFDNLIRDHFHGSAQIVFDAMQELMADGMDLCWNTVMDKTGAAVPAEFFIMLREATAGVHRTGYEPYLREKVKAIKSEATQMKLVSEINEIAGKNTIGEDDIDELEKTILSARLVDRPREEPTLASAISAYQEHIRQRASDITLGLPTLDRQIDGFNPGELVTIFARAAVGKTFLALNIIDRLAARVPYKMALFSLEMPKAAIVERLLEVHYGISRHEAKRRALEDGLDPEFEQTFGKLAVYDKIYSVAEIRKIVEREAYRIVFIDFLHLIRPEDPKAGPYVQVSQIVQGIKQMAKDTRCVAFLLHQLSRRAGSGSTKVEIDHARDSGQVEELSDFIIGVWAPGLDPSAPPDMDQVLSCSLLKNKRGQRWSYDLHFDKNCGRICEEAEEEYPNRGHRDWSESRSEEA